MTKHDSYREYALKSGYGVTFNNHSQAISKWVGNGPEPQARKRNHFLYLLPPIVGGESRKYGGEQKTSVHCVMLFQTKIDTIYPMICFSTKSQMKSKMEEMPQTP